MSESQKIGPELPVRLREITAKTVRQICRLSDTLSEAHQHMVAPNAVSIAEAHFNEYAWFRAIYAGEEPVGFIMLYIGPDDDQPDKTIHFLWRFMIAGPYQGMGFGDKALRIVIEDLKTRGVSELRTSCGLGEGSPESFYLKMGFVPTGRMLGEEKELNLAFQQSNESTSP
jgi:diamine N-acetyltransferase